MFFSEKLRLAEGEHAGQPFDLALAQAFIVGSLFGWKGEDGYRRFRTAYVEMGKGNGKSPLAAGIGLRMLTSDREEGAECYAAAVTRDQAGIMFRDAERMVESSPKLRDNVTRNVANLAVERTGSFFRPVSSEGRSLDGKRVHYAGIDEIHEHRDSVVVDKMRAGTKGRRQALIFEITNSGYDRNSVCWQHHEYSRRVVSGEVEDDSWFAYVCALDDGDDWRDPSCWIKANPLLGVSITEKYLREQVREAEGMPAKQSLVRRLNFCEWTESAAPAIERRAWLACIDKFDLEALAGLSCWGGLDLSGKNDLTALSLAFEKVKGKTRAATWFWSPEDGIRDREDRDGVPYLSWCQQGYMERTPGRSIDYRFAAQQLKRLSGLFDIQALAFDRWRIDDFLRACDDVGLEVWVEGKDKHGSGLRLVPHGQGFADMSPAVDALETAILNGELRVLDNPVMTMCAANAVYAFDPAGNRKFDKRPDRSYGRIDGMVSLAMAMRLAAKAMPDQAVDLNKMLIEQGERFVI
ncbi:MAG: terminase large subunit [Hyphomicrobiaceae bacterium]